MRLKQIIMALGLSLGVCSSALADYPFYNPLGTGADPWCIYKDGYYYYMDTYGGVNIKKSWYIVDSSLGTPGVPWVTVFTPPAPYNQHIWAAELHYINGNWYMYYSADDGPDIDHRTFVAKADTQDPMGTWTYQGRLYDSGADYWAIDGTVLQKDDGTLYFIWSGHATSSPGSQYLYIAPMSNPWTISGPRVRIGASTYYSWEYAGSMLVNEGPEIIEHNGKINLVYSANGSWTDNYCLGLLQNSDGNVLNPGSWTKYTTPIFQTYVGSDGSVYAPGHCSFTKSLDGSQDWIVYHAAISQGSGFDRNIRAQRFTWNGDGSPNLGHPIPGGVAVSRPSGEGINNEAAIDGLVRTNGSTSLYAAGLDGNVWTRYQTNSGGSWLPLTSWASLGGSELGRIWHTRVVQQTDGTQVLFGLQPGGGALWYREQTSPGGNGSWGAWTSLGGQTKAFDVQVYPNGSLAVYALSIYDVMWTKWQNLRDGSWSDWAAMGGADFNRIHMLTQTDGTSMCFCLDGSGHIWHTWQTNWGSPWSGWVDMGNTFDSFNSVLYPDGNMGLFGTSGGQLWTRWQDTKGGPWSSWAYINGSGLHNLHVLQQTNGATSVFEQGYPGDATSLTWQTNSGGYWNPGISLGGTIADSQVVLYPNGSEALYGIDAIDRTCYTQWQTNQFGSWFGWGGLGGGPFYPR